MATGADFYPRPPRGGRQHRLRHIFRPVEFLSTPSARRATRDFHRASSFRSISIHALREEGDPRSIMRLQVRYNFYPRPPRGGRPGSLSEPHRPVLFLSTPSARRATPGAVQGRDLRPDISIHALREEGDGDRFLLRHIAGISIHALREEGDKRQWPRPTARTISIHALREEGDGSSPIKFHARRGFLSTPSARRATKLPPRKRSSQKNFYPRPPRGGRQSGHPALDAGVRISIHALREEGDRAGIPPSMRVSEFLSTPSARRATRRWLGRGSGTDYFYPRPPRGGRLIMSNHQDSGDLFLSTPSARRATGKQDLLKYSYGISIHALREEGDCAT